LFPLITAYRANNGDVGKALVVVVTKMSLAGMVVVLSLLLIGGIKSAFESFQKASKIVGNNAEERKSIKRPKEQAAESLILAALAGAVLYSTYGFIKKLVKESPCPQFPPCSIPSDPPSQFLSNLSKMRPIYRETLL
jgi:hypothetical protein